jgi:hypothetical protein
MSWVFLVLCFSLGTYLVAGFDNQASFYFVFIYCLVTPLVTASLFHLGLVFPDRKRILSRFPAIEYIIYLPALVLGIAFQISFSLYPKILNPDTLKWLPDFKQISSINRIFTIFCVIGMFIFLFHSLFKSSTIMARQRARIIIFGMACAFVPSAIISTLVTFMKVNFPWNFLVFFLIFFPASIAYSIVRHNLFDADTIIRRTVGYFVVTAIVIGAYILVSVAFNIFMGSYQLAQSQIFPIMFTLAVILVFNPLRDRIQALVDRVFFRKEYDYGSIVEKVGGAMTSIMELPQILKHLTQTFIEDMFIDTSSVMLLNSTGAEYQVCLADGERKEKVANILSYS